MLVPIQQLSHQARSWVYSLKAPISNTQQVELEQLLSKFIDQWSSHGNNLHAGFQVVDQVMLVVAVENGFEAASGCSIDKLTAIIQQAENQLQLGLLDRMNLVFKKEDGKVVFETFSNIKASLSQEPQIANWYIANNQEQSLNQYLKTPWIPVKDSWLARFIPAISL
jgi:hypothetical protein